MAIFSRRAVPEGEPFPTRGWRKVRASAIWGAFFVVAIAFSTEMAFGWLAALGLSLPVAASLAVAIRKIGVYWVGPKGLTVRAPFGPDQTIDLTGLRAARIAPGRTPTGETTIGILLVFDHREIFLAPEAPEAMLETLGRMVTGLYRYGSEWRARPGASPSIHRL